MKLRWAFQKIFHVHILSSEANGPACLAGNFISNADKKLCSIHQFACTLIWCPARPAKRDLFNNFTPILLHPQAMLTFKWLRIWRHFLPKYHITTTKNKDKKCPFWLPAQRDTSFIHLHIVQNLYECFSEKRFVLSSPLEKNMLFLVLIKCIKSFRKKECMFLSVIFR